MSRLIGGFCRFQRRHAACAWIALAVWLLLPGCAAFHPIDGVPARYLPDEFRGESRAGKRTIDLSLLKQKPPGKHLVDSGDVLGIYIEGVLGDRKLAPPVNIPLNHEFPPSFGFPIPVRDDGTISLPMAGAINVRGLTIAEIEMRLKEAYTKNKEFLNPENDRIFVSLQQSRTYRVLVIRQEAGTPFIATPGMLNTGTLKRGMGQLVHLPAYKNDVLHALAQTGGLPGLDAENAIYIIRRRKSQESWVPPPPAIPLPAASGAMKFDKDKFVVRAQGGNWSPPMPSQEGYSAETIISPQLQAPGPLPSTFQPDANHTPPIASPPSGISRYGVPSAESPNPHPPFVPPAPAQQIPQADWQFRHSQPTPLFDAHLPPLPKGMPTAIPPLDPLPTMTPEEFGWDFNNGGLDGRHIVKIPVRLGPGETVDLTEADVILEDGDIVFIESRDTEVFYTGGLLGGGQYTLPRDYDLNVLQAIAVSQGQQSGSGGSRGTTSSGGPSALNNDVSISASSVVILRYLPDGRMIPIEVDLYKARTDVAEQVVIQPGDYLLLQYTKLEACAAFVERHLLEGALFGLAASQFSSNRN